MQLKLEARTAGNGQGPSSTAVPCASAELITQGPPGPRCQPPGWVLQEGAHGRHGHSLESLQPDRKEAREARSTETDGEGRGWHSQGGHRHSGRTGRAS